MKSSNIKVWINVFLVSILSFTILFFALGDNIDVNKYSIILGIIWMLIFLNFKRKISKDSFAILSAISMGSSVSFLIIKTFYSKINGINEHVHMLNVFIIGFNVVLFMRSIVVKSYMENDIENKELMRKRKFDLQRIVEYLNELNIIAINGKWGEGKTFLVDKLKEEVKDEYEIIQIDVLSCNLDDLQLVLIKEIEKILYRKGVLSQYSRKLANFFKGESKIKSLFGISIIENHTYLEIIKGFKKELRKLEKRILIIYEDIDRISNKEIIKSIFALSENISDDTIKIIYEYDEENLKAIEFDDNYLEKYMPYKINLTEMNFWEILEFKLCEKNIDQNILTIEDFEFLKEYILKNRFRYLDKLIGYSIDMEFKLKDITIRKMEHFIAEILVALKYNEDLSIKLKSNNRTSYKEIVISFFYVKHFITPVYNQIISNESLLETFKFKIEYNEKECEYNFLDLIDLYESKKINVEQIKKMFDNDKTNRLNYFSLKLFNYNIQEELIKGENGDQRLFRINNEPVQNLIDRVENEKKDRIIWWLLESGKSKITDYEYEAGKIIKDVLSKEGNKEIVKAYYEFCDHMYTLDKYYIDNSTTQMMGESMFIELFKAFNIREVTEEEQFKLLILYFQVEKEHSITDEVINILNYCKLRSRKEYIKILKEFNKLDIIGNFNDKKLLLTFITKYIRALSNHKIGFCNTHDIVCIPNEDRTHIDKGTTKLVLNDFIRTLKLERENIKKIIIIENIDDEFSTVIEFINKLLELINVENEYINQRDGLKMDYKMVSPNESEIDRLKKIYISEHMNFEEELQKSYEAGKITPYEIDALTKKINIDIKK